MKSTGFAFRQWPGMVWVALLAACLLSMLLVTYPIFDFDFYWHLANGREMVNSAQIISKEVFSYTHPGEHFANHEWLSQVLLYLVWHAFGSHGLLTMKLIIVGMITWLLFLTLRNEEQSPAIAALLTVLVVLAGLNRYHVRPELFTLLNMALLGFILYGFCRQKVSRAVLWAIPLIMVVWDWLHGAVYGFAFLAMFVVGENLKHRVQRLQPQSTLSHADLKTLNLCFAITLLAMLVNPFGLRTYGMFVGYVTGESNLNTVITEYTPISWEYSRVFILMFAWFVLLALRNWKRVDITQLLVAMVFALATLRFSRMEAAAAIVMAPAIAGLLKLSMQASSRNFERKFHTATLMIGGVLVLWYGYAIKFIPDAPEPDSDQYHYVNIYDLSFGYRKDDSIYPVGAVNFIRDHKLTGHLYNSGNFGGYLSYQITPERKIFQYNMGTFGNPLYYVRHPDALAKWDINYAIVGTNMEMNLFPEKEWATVYCDAASVLLIRRTPRNAALIDQYEVHYFSPALSGASLLKEAKDPEVLPVLADEIGDYLDERKDRRIAAVWARILTGHAQLRREQQIQQRLTRALKYNPDPALEEIGARTHG